MDRQPLQRWSQVRGRPTPGRTARAPDPLPTDMAVYAASKAALNRLTVAFAAALNGTGIRVNTVEPRAAVLTEGARSIMGDTFDPESVESIEAMVEGALVLCDGPPELTGGVHDSLGLLEWQDAAVMALDGTGPYPGGLRPMLASD